MAVLIPLLCNSSTAAEGVPWGEFPADISRGIPLKYEKKDRLEITRYYAMKNKTPKDLLVTS